MLSAPLRERPLKGCARSARVNAGKGTTKRWMNGFSLLSDQGCVSKGRRFG